MFHLNPASPTVVVDGATGRPRLIRLAGDRLAVTHVRSVRDETAAYPATTGPRTVLVVEAAGRRFRLVHRLRDRRWLVDELDAEAMSSQAA
jgi:hypothetical protein